MCLSSASLRKLSVCLFVCEFVCMFLYVYVYVFEYCKTMLGMCVFVCFFVCVCVCVCVCMCVYMSVCVCLSSASVYNQSPIDKIHPPDAINDTYGYILKSSVTTICISLIQDF